MPPAAHTVDPATVAVSVPADDIIAPGAVITHATESKGGRIAILDAGAQYGKVIDRRIRELSIQSDILPLNTTVSVLAEYGAIIISGGPQSVYGEQAPQYDPQLFTLSKPILGICYGLQLINHVFGGKIEKKTTREDGQFAIKINNNTSLLYKGLPETIDVLLTHGDSISTIAPSFISTGMTDEGLICSIEHTSLPIYGVQYHPEVDLTTHGNDILLNFITHIASLSRTFTLHNRLHSIIAEIQHQCHPNKQVLMLLSGGVDSSVCAALLKTAIGADRIHAIHIDNGFMRLAESDKVYAALSSIGLPLTVIQAQQQFYNATTMIKDIRTPPLCSTINPEHKRKIIGDTFMHVSAAHIASLNLSANDTLLAQGTLRPDLIESASSLASHHADVIKTHHNDTALVRALRDQQRIIEPLRDYHKDEVRQLGLELGLPVELVWRQPFPGPGLAIRIICADQPYITENDHHIIQQAQSFATSSIGLTLIPCRTVGVQGDARTYSSLIALSSTSLPSMIESSSLSLAHIDWSALFSLAKLIPKKIHGINRVIYVFGKPLNVTHYTTITPTYLTPDVIHQLQQADDIVNQILLQYNLMTTLSQVPVILFPCHFNKGEGNYRSICIRTFITNDFMTGVPAIPGINIPLIAIESMVNQILTKVPGIARVCFDLTSKPPATTEWE